jgi:hypothetical protein
VFFQFGTNAASEGYDTDDLYKCVVTDTDETTTLLLDFPGSTELNLKKAISSDGTTVIAFEWLTEAIFYPATVYPYASAALLDADGWPGNRPDYDAYWGDTENRLTTGDNRIHDQTLRGAGSDIWFHVMLEGTDGMWWRMKPTGTEADGGPSHTSDNSFPYSWGGEMEPTNTSGRAKTGNDPWDSTYFSHYAVGRWGRYIVFSNTTTSGTGTFDLVDQAYEMETDAVGPVEHHDYSAWSDWVTSSGDPNLGYDDQMLYITKYNDANSEITLNDLMYDNLARPTQSPDGTKVFWHSSFLYADDDSHDIFYSVAYYPYPPEIDSVTATGGAVTVTVWWNLGTTPRGYTQRGWPNEGSDPPPPPREIKQFRLWRCQGTCTATSGTWTPVDTRQYGIFDLYDFSDGTWNSGTEATNKWKLGVSNVVDGDWYYGVTSQEHSGLESLSLSNIFKITVSGGSGTGSEPAGADYDYPTSPGGDNDFYASYNAANTSLVRYYNIYAADDDSQAIQQQDRIASIPVGHCSLGTCSWVDWLGDATDPFDTEHIVTAVDSQGNESTALGGVTSTHKLSPATEDGQYTIQWADLEYLPLTSAKGITIGP